MQAFGVHVEFTSLYSFEYDCFWLQVRGHDNQKTCCMCPNLPMMSSFSASSPVIG